MNEHEITILTKFYDLYQKRVISQGNLGIKKININISYDKTVWYFNDKNNYDIAINRLENERIIKVKRNLYKDPITIQLLIVEDLPNLLGYEDYPSLEPLIIKSKTSKSKIVQKFFKQLTSLVENKKSIKSYFSNNELDKDWLKSIEAVELLEKIQNKKINISERDFSTAIFNDSKSLEKYITKIKKICGSVKDDSSFLEEYGIVKNSLSLQVRGKATIYIGQNTHIDLSDGNVWGMPPFADYSKIYGLSILSVENLTTFFDVELSGFDMIFYLGGHMTKDKLSILKILSLKNNISHWGDLDVGGYIILTELRKNGVKVKSLNMNKSFIKDNKKFFVSLNTKNIEDIEIYKNNLQRLLSNEYLVEEEKQCIEFLINENLWYEQEAYYAKQLLLKVDE